MADEATIFTGVTAPPVDATTTTPTQGELISALVGEGKKYKTPEDLAKAYVNADDFIEKLKEENKELRDKVAAAKSIDDVLSRLSTPPTDTDKSANPTEGLSAKDVAEIVRTTVTGLETDKTKRTNLQKSDAKMKELFGEKAGEVYKSAASTEEQHQAYMALAAVDPDRFVRLFTEGGSTTTTTQTDTSGSSTRTIVQSGGGDRSKVSGTKEYYSNLRRTNPSSYYSQTVQLEMDRAARENPTKFYGR